MKNNPQTYLKSFDSNSMPAYLEDCLKLKLIHDSMITTICDSQRRSCIVGQPDQSKKSSFLGRISDRPIRRTACHSIVYSLKSTFVLALLILSTHGVTQAQQSSIPQLQSVQGNINPLTLQQLRQELSKRGISESALRSRLIQRGIVLENLNPADLPRYRSIILEVIAELEQEKLAKEGDEDVEDLTAEERARMEESVLDSILIEAPDIYGHELFRQGNLNDFILSDSPEAPDSYVLGAGDRLRVTLFGISQGDFVLEINEEGYVQPENMAKIFLRGFTYGEAKRLLLQRFGSAYTFQIDQFNVTLQQPRTITINVLGEAMRKGSFTMSPFNTVLNALYAAGGPDSLGTVRNIEIIRGSEKRVIDLYQILNNPSGELNFDLNHRDILFFPTQGNVVRIEGAVNRPMRYELKAEETIEDLITYAGGLQAGAYPDFAQIERFERGELKLIDVELGATPAIPLQNGDVIRVRPSRRAIDSRITILGAVYYPDTLGYSAGLTLEEAIRRSGGLKPSAISQAFLQRRDLNDTTQVSFQTIQLSNPATMAMALQPLDEIRILDKSDYTNMTGVGITGAVKQPLSLPYTSQMTIQDLFLAAGGTQLGASLARVQVFRRKLFTDREQILDEILISVDSSYNVIQPAGFQLRPFDQVVVRQTPGYNLETAVEINGEVNYPGVYILENAQTHLSDLIRKAGGLRSTADPIGSTLFREFGDRGFIVTNLRQATSNPRNQQFDPILFPGDVVNINRRENTVSLTGEGLRLRLAVDDTLANDQLSLTYQGPKSAKWYIQNYGGGFNKDADLASVTVKLKNGQVLATKKRLFGRKYPKVQPGSTIEVDLKPAEVLQAEQEKFDWDQFASRTIQTTTSIVTILLLARQL